MSQRLRDPKSSTPSPGLVATPSDRRSGRASAPTTKGSWAREGRKRGERMEGGDGIAARTSLLFARPIWFAHSPPRHSPVVLYVLLLPWDAHAVQGIQRRYHPLCQEVPFVQCSPLSHLTPYNKVYHLLWTEYRAVQQSVS